MAFPTATIIDTLKVSAGENPISAGGSWGLLPWATSIGKKHEAEDGYTPNTGATAINGAYWTLTEWKNPAAGWQMLFPENKSSEYLALWIACSTANHNGYRLKAVPTGTEANFNLFAERVTAGTATELTKVAAKKITAKDYVGIGVTGGKVTIYYKSGEAGAWEEPATVADSTYTGGLVAMEVDGNEGSFGQANLTVGGEATSLRSLMPVVV